jgi:hypothetical protein
MPNARHDAGTGSKGDRAQRREARKALSQARRAAKEARKLRKSLKGANRERLESVAAAAESDVARARADLDARPGRAARSARRITSRLEKASIRATASGSARRRALRRGAGPEANEPDAAKAAKARAKLVKQRRAQAKTANKMAKKVALGVVTASIFTPSDEDRRKKDRKRIERRVKHA